MFVLNLRNRWQRKFSTFGFVIFLPKFLFPVLVFSCTAIVMLRSYVLNRFFLTKPVERMMNRGTPNVVFRLRTRGLHRYLRRKTQRH